MHIGFLTPEYPHPDFNRSGGLGTSIKNLATALVNRNVEVTVFVTWQAQDKTFFEDGVRIMSIAKKQHLLFNWYIERKRIQNIIQQHIDTDGIQLIEAPDWTGLSAFMKFTVPLIIRMNGSDGYFCHLEGRQQKWKHRFIERKALQSADALVSASSFTGQVTKSLFGLKKEITTIHNSIDTAVFVPLKESVRPLQILYFGTLVRKKGVLELPFIFNAIVKQVPDAELVLIGKDNTDVFTQKSTWSLFQEALSPKAKRSVTHLNEVSYETVKTYVAQAQVIVLPSYAEAFPMTWLETLAMEKPLVCSNIGWAKELMIDGKTGYMVAPDDHNAFAEKVIALLEDEALRVSMGSYARAHVERHFSTAIITKQNIDYYHSLIQG
ncbi:glycosyltransferase family 4 protein [Gaetbulibacter sp. PBL-D1]|uniref:glycosyltransferase family 4 protein n=1 Tax=Gaetbulibacter sp. PBL-D1 TaxID=3422594 RepID=UPI003D2EEE99